MNKKRCDWCTDHALYIAYHDKEWGVPVYNDRKLFEFLILESMQAGLSWFTILQKREAFRDAFANFNAEKIARFPPSEVEKLLQNENIIRNRRKIEAVISNAKAFLELKNQETLSHFLWKFVDGEPQKNHWKTIQQVPIHTPESDRMTQELKRKKFTFVGSTTCYAFMQAVGMVNDHLVDCFRHNISNVSYLGTCKK